MKERWSKVKQIAASVPAIPGRGRRKTSPDIPARVVAELLRQSPARRKLLESAEFKRAITEIAAHDGAAEALALLCNALLVDRVNYSAKVVLQARRERRAIVQAAKLLRGARAALDSLRASIPRRTYRERFKTSGGLMIPEAISILAEELDGIGGATNPEIPGLDGRSIGKKVKDEVTAQVAARAGAARDIWTAFPPALRRDYELIAKLMTLAGFDTAARAVKSAVQRDKEELYGKAQGRGRRH